MERQVAPEVRLDELAQETRQRFMAPGTFNLKNPLESPLDIARRLIEQSGYEPFTLLSQLTQQTRLAPRQIPMIFETFDQETWGEFVYDLCATIIDAQIRQQFPEVFRELDRRLELQSEYSQG